MKPFIIAVKTEQKIEMRAALQVTRAHNFDIKEMGVNWQMASHKSKKLQNVNFVL